MILLEALMQFPRDENIKNMRLENRQTSGLANPWRG